MADYKTSSTKFKQIKGVLRQIDLFSIIFTFRSDKTMKFSSLLSSLCFLFYIIFVLLFILKALSDFFAYDYRIQYIRKYIDSFFIIDEKNFFYSFKFVYTQTINVDHLLYNTTNINQSQVDTSEYNVIGSKFESLFKIQASYVQKFNHGKNSTKEIINQLKCNTNLVKDSIFYNSLQDKSNIDEYDDVPKLIIDDHICFKYSSHRLYGKYSDEKFSYIEVGLDFNKTFYELYPDNLEKILQNTIFKFSLYYSDHVYDVSESEAVKNRVESTIYSYINPYIYERTTVFFNRLNYTADTNLFIKNPKSNSYIIFSNNEKNLTPFSFRFLKENIYKDKLSLIKYYLRPDDGEVNVIVSSIKFPEFLSGVSAISTNSFVALSLILSYYNRFYAKQKVISKTMKYAEDFSSKNKNYVDYFLNKINLRKEIKYKEKLQEKEKFEKNNASNNNVKIKTGNNITNRSYLSENETFYLNEIIEDKNKDSTKSKQTDDEKIYPYVYRKNNRLHYETKTSKMSKNIQSEIKQERGRGIVNDLNDDNLSHINNKNKSEIELNYISNVQKNNDFDNNNNNKSEKHELKTVQFNQLEKDLNKRIEKLKITNFDFIKYYLCCNKLKKKTTIFKIAEAKFNERMNLYNYLRKMNEIDVIKFLIFDKNLLNIFNFVSKDNISNESLLSYKDDEYHSFFKENYLKAKKYDISFMNKIKDSFDHIYLPNNNQNPFYSAMCERMCRLFDFNIQELRSFK